MVQFDKKHGLEEAVIGGFWRFLWIDGLNGGYEGLEGLIPLRNKK